MNEIEWVLCPVCKNKTRIKIRTDTVLENFPLFCPKCKQETLIRVKELHTTVIKEPDAEPIIRNFINANYWLFAFELCKYVLLKKNQTANYSAVWLNEGVIFCANQSFSGR